MFDSDVGMVRIDMSEFMDKYLGVSSGWCASGDMSVMKKVAT